MTESLGGEGRMIMENFSGIRTIRAFLFLALIHITILGFAAPGLGNNLKKIILIETMPVPAVLESTYWFVTQLKDMGYKEGKDFNLRILKANGDRTKAETLLRDALSKDPPDVVVTNATLASQSAAKVLKGSKIPIVFFTVGDPVGAGLIKKIGVPTGTHITGKVKSLPSKIRIDIIFRLVGQIVKSRPIRLGYIYPTYPSSIGDLRKLQAASEGSKDIVFVPYQIECRKIPSGLPAMLEDTVAGIRALSGQVDFWWESAGPLGEVPEYTQILLDHSSLPIAVGHRMDSVKMGALACINASFEASGRETAMLVDAILKGTDPGDIPTTPPTSFNLGINLTTALKIDVVVPPDIMELAGRHIYK